MAGCLAGASLVAGCANNVCGFAAIFRRPRLATCRSCTWTIVALLVVGIRPVSPSLARILRLEAYSALRTFIYGVLSVTEARPLFPCYASHMPKLMPLSDFRARRTVLTRRDFGYAPKPAPPPSDLVRKATWDSIVTLPDDVRVVRTTNYHRATRGLKRR